MISEQGYHVPRCLHISVMEFPNVVQKKLNPKSKKTIRFRDFWEKKFADSLALYMPKPDKNDAFKHLNGMLQKCSNFFQSDFAVIYDLKLDWKKVWSPHITGQFPEESGASEQQPKRGTTCLLLQYGFELRAGHILW